MQLGWHRGLGGGGDGLRDWLLSLTDLETLSLEPSEALPPTPGLSGEAPEIIGGGGRVECWGDLRASWWRGALAPSTHP